MRSSTQVYDTHAFSRQLPSEITFHVEFVETSSYNYIFRDTRFADDLWGAALAKKMTDVELFVDSITFTAHRAVLSARSPVFYSMFNSSYLEETTGKVHIEGVNADTFAQFLRFLYTGLLGDEHRAIKEELYALADKYDVKTLMKICRPTTRKEVEKEMDDLFTI